jgi:hypothetical protein
MTPSRKILPALCLLWLGGCAGGEVKDHQPDGGAGSSSSTGAGSGVAGTGAAGDSGGPAGTGAAQAGAGGATSGSGVAGSSGAAGTGTAGAGTGTAGAGTGTGTGGATGGGGTTTPLIWPNEMSSANSDPWLLQHHTEITEIHPRFLVIDFANGRTTASVMTRFQQQKEALMEGSRYHGYSNPAAKPFVIYELAKYVDLKDNPIPAGWTAPNSTKMPRRDGGIKFSSLFTQQFADYYAIPDPQDPTHNLTLCELFALGIVNDVFIVFNKTGVDGNVPEVLEYKQMYDVNDVKRAGKFDQFAGNGSFNAEDLPLLQQCGRSVRIDFLEMTGNFTNAMEVDAHNFEHIGQRSVPRFYLMFKPFGNFDLGTRFATTFADWYACPYDGANTCLSYPDPNTVTWNIGGQTGTFKPFNQGCGNAHFPPNARGQYDKSNPQVVNSTCEHYGLHDGPGGADLQTPYSITNTDRYKGTPTGDAMRGGGWFMYWFQSWPGYGNKATMADGSPMKNWWVYLYY